MFLGARMTKQFAFQDGLTRTLAQTPARIRAIRVATNMYLSRFLNTILSIFYRI